MRFFLKILFIFLVGTGFAFANVNVNTANVSELSQFPGVGKVIAQRIIDYRSTNGAFASCDQLIKVKGIGTKTMAKIQPLCHVGDGKVRASKPVESKSKGAIDFNKATAADLITIKGIGKKMAARIIADRDSNGAFSSCDDLIRVKGIGPAKMKNLKPYCSVAAKK